MQQPTGTGLAPTGKNCLAECKEAADCCELPLELHVPYTVLTPYGAGAESCADLAAQLAAVNCEGVLTAANAAKCLAQAAYCDCAAKTWACEAGRCSYTAGCTDDGAVPAGCPTYTRSGKGVYPLCNTDGACAPEAVDGLCAKDTDCDGEAMADLGLLCEEGECTCYKDTQSCYRRCDAPLDCQPGYTCDDANVCVPVAACTSDAQCALSLQNPNARCVDEVCRIGCSGNFDCNSGSYQAGIATLVCNADHVCEPIGCSSDDQCSSGLVLNTGVKMFCAAPEAAPGVAVVRSAITD